MPIPKKIRNYRILRQLAQGGITSDYLAENEELGKKVMLRVSNYPTDKKKRLLHVAQLHAKLSHPNIHDLYDFFEAEGFLWSVLKHIEGQDLQSYIVQHAPLKWKHALQLVVQASDALAYMHRHGVVNGSIKGKNILIEEDRIYISKFNAARAIPDDDTMPPDTFIGNRIYCAPEQLQGFAYTTPKSDIWSLGVVLHEMVAQTTFVAEEQQEVAFNDIPEVEFSHLYPPDLPYEVVELINSMLEKNVEKRCSSCDELSQRMRTLLSSSTAFLVMPFHPKFQKVREVIKNVCDKLGVNYYVVDEQHETGDIVLKIRSNIQKADFIIADVSPVGSEFLRDGKPMANSNVIYELGLAHGYNKDTIILTQDLLTLSFDIAKENAVIYHPDRLDTLEQDLSKFVVTVTKRLKNS
jgi:serine/threonine protein kinase